MTYFKGTKRPLSKELEEGLFSSRLYLLVIAKEMREIKYLTTCPFILAMVASCILGGVHCCVNITLLHPSQPSECGNEMEMEGQMLASRSCLGQRMQEED